MWSVLTKSKLKYSPWIVHMITTQSHARLNSLETPGDIFGLGIIGCEAPEPSTNRVARHQPCHLHPIHSCHRPMNQLWQLWKPGQAVAAGGGRGIVSALQPFDVRGPREMAWNLAGRLLSRTWLEQATHPAYVFDFAMRSSVLSSAHCAAQHRVNICSRLQTCTTCRADL